MLSDAEIVQRCRAGDVDAFRPIVERYQVRAFGHALMLVGNREDAADAVQEAFQDVFQTLSKFDASRDFYPWYYVLLRNRCFKVLRSRKRRDAAMTEFAELVRLLQSSTAKKDEQHELEDALWRLEAEDREIITLRHFDGLTYSELAERLSIPKGTVMSRLYHARCRLRTKLDRATTNNGTTHESIM